MATTELTDASIKTKQPAPSKTLNRFLRYALRRGSIILATIILGTYVTVIVANKGGQVDDHVRRDVQREFFQIRRDECGGLPLDQWQECQDQLRAELEEEAGLNQPDAVRNIRYTLNSLIFDWGNANFTGTVSFYSRYADRNAVQDLILKHFPNTLLLFGTADLIIFLVGIPLALHLSTKGRKYWLDKLVSLIVPLSSVPSWVHGVILVSIFAVNYHLLPYGGKYDILPPENTYELIVIVGKHMILPVSAILLSMFFHLVYTWRTYFIIHSDEDHVELAQAKGLPNRLLEQRYIMQPTLPYLLTSFALTLVGFWQMATALEYFFNWPGLGLLYVNAVPNFWGEAFFPGEMGVVLSIVVIFAYLLGLVVFSLDITYALLDPRIRVETDRQRSRLVKNKKGWARLNPFHRRDKKEPVFGPRPGPALATQTPPAKRSPLKNFRISFGRGYTISRTVVREIFKYPSAIIGLILIVLFVSGSLYAVIALPYAEIGANWHKETITGKVYTPRNVFPSWTNWFRDKDAPVTQIYKTEDGSLPKAASVDDSGNPEYTFSIPVEYPYQDFPQDMILYIDATFAEKHPHLTITWVTPDGREMALKSPSLASDLTYYFEDYIVHQRFLRLHPLWNEWFELGGASPTPKINMLFADPRSNEEKAAPGTYRLDIRARTFEAGSDVDLEFVMLGSVYGFAGTDSLGRDLTVPLFWGMPFTLAFGVVGAIGTTILAMILAAVGVWVGGWADILVQRISEANMILPILAIGILVFALYGVGLWTVITVIILLGAFGSATKAFRAAFLQVSEAPYIESARAYGAGSARIIFRYMIPRVMPTLIPQFINLIPSLVFLEATLAIFNAIDPRFPTWGRVIYDAINDGALWGGAEYRVLVPISLLLLIGLAFALVGFAVERILNPRMQNV